MATLPSCLPLGPSLAVSLWLWEWSAAAQQRDPLGRNWQRFLEIASKEPRASSQPENRVLSTITCELTERSPPDEPSSEAAAPANTVCSLKGAGTLRHGYLLSHAWFPTHSNVGFRHSRGDLQHSNRCLTYISYCTVIQKKLNSW